MIATLERSRSRSSSPLSGTPSRFTSPRWGEDGERGAAAVACKSVTKEFGGLDTKTIALRGVDLNVDDGQLTLLVGPSGCGKTTLISIIAGLLNPTLGNVAIFGTDL